MLVKLIDTLKKVRFNNYLYSARFNERLKKFKVRIGNSMISSGI